MVIFGNQGAEDMEEREQSRWSLDDSSYLQSLATLNQLHGSKGMRRNKDLCLIVHAENAFLFGVKACCLWRNLALMMWDMRRSLKSCIRKDCIVWIQSPYVVWWRKLSPEKIKLSAFGRRNCLSKVHFAHQRWCREPHEGLNEISCHWTRHKIADLNIGLLNTRKLAKQVWEENLQACGPWW